MRQRASRVRCNPRTPSDMAGPRRSRYPDQRSGHAFSPDSTCAPRTNDCGIRLGHRQIFLGVAVSVGCQFLSEGSMPDR